MVEGVVVLAEGADDAVVVRNITAVVQALFDVDSHKIKVIERNLKSK
jgi:stage III sporulation protein AG